MKIIKILITSLVSLVLIIAVAIGVFTAITDPNDHKEFITSNFNQATGRDLTLAGDIEFTLFPKLGIQLGQTQISNAKGFAQTHFAQLENIIIRADLLSLFMFKLQADTIELHGLQVNLEKNQAGVSNWQDLIAESPQQSQDSHSLNDENSNIRNSVKVPLGIEVAGIKITDARLVYEDAIKKNTTTIDQINLSTGAIGRSEFSPLEATLRVTQTTPKSQAELSLNSDMMLDLNQMRLQMQDLQLKVHAKTPDLPKPGIKLAFDTHLDIDHRQESLSLSDLRLAINDTAFEGQFSVQSFAKPNIHFSLHSDEIDVDKLVLVPASSNNGSTSDTIQLPVQHLRQMTVQGDLAVNTLHSSGFKVTDLKSVISVKQGVAEVKDLKFDLYSGTYQGAAMLDVTQSNPVYSARSQLKDLAIGEFLQSLSGGKRALIRGQSALDFNIQTSGKRISDLKKKLNGKLSFRAMDGALQDESLAKNIEYVVAFLQGRSPKASGKEILFENFSGSGVIKDGILSNKDLALVAPLIGASGRGQVDLASERIAYTLNIGIAGEDSRKLPIDISGPLSDPHYNFDIKSVITGQQKQKIEEKKDQIKEKLLEGAGEKLDDGLKEKIKKFKFF